MNLFKLILFFITLNSFAQINIVDKIEFLEAKSFNKKFLTNLIHTKTGSVLDTLQINKEIIVLSRLNGISNVIYEVLKSENNLYNINFVIKENYTLIPALSIGTTDDVGVYRLGLYEFNFLGKNNTLGGFYQYNGFNSFGIRFTSPCLFKSYLGIETNIQKLSSIEPIFFNNTKANYRYTNTAFELLGVYQINYKNAVKLGFNIFNEKYLYKDGATANDIPQNLNVDKQLLKFQYIYDHLNYNYYLVNGFKSSFAFQYVLSKNDFQKEFTIGWNDFSLYRYVGNKGNWVSRLRLGLSSNNKSPFSPFAVDNNLNIRGVGNIIDRGTGTIVLNTEFRQTIFERKWFVMQGNVFIDGGTWRTPGENFSDFTNKKNVRLYPGVGLRFIHKTIFNAVLRIDYGYGVSQNASKGFVFGIGQYF
jgi:hypothetical protein